MDAQNIDQPTPAVNSNLEELQRCTLRSGRSLNHIAQRARSQSPRSTRDGAISPIHFDIDPHLSTSCPVTVDTETRALISDMHENWTAIKSAYERQSARIASIENYRPNVQPQAKISDMIIAPKHFDGDTNKTDPEQWLTFYNRFAQFKNLSDSEKISVFSLLMQGNAADWIATLSYSQTSSWNHLEKAFKSTYFKSDYLKWQEAGMLWNNPQQPNEKVDDFVIRIKKPLRAFRYQITLYNMHF